MSDRSEFQIDLPVEAVVCRVHGELFRLTWPAGYPIFSVHAAHTVLNEPPGLDILHAHAGEDAARLNAVIAEFGPLCRMMSADQRLAAYNAAAASPNWGERAVCEACGKWKLGARGLYAPRGGGEAEEHFVCIECAARKTCET